MSNSHQETTSSEFTDDVVPHPTHDLHAATDPHPHRTWFPLVILEYLGAAVVLLMAILITTSVTMRALGYGLTGVIELSSVAMILLVLLGAPGLASRDEHVRLDLIDMVVNAGKVRWISLASGVLQLIVIAVLCYAVWLLFQTDLVRGTTVAGELRIPRFWVTGATVVGFIALGAGVIHRMLHVVRNQPQHQED